MHGKQMSLFTGVATSSSSLHSHCVLLSSYTVIPSLWFVMLRVVAIFKTFHLLINVSYTQDVCVCANVCWYDSENWYHNCYC